MESSIVVGAFNVGSYNFLPKSKTISYFNDLYIYKKIPPMYLIATDGYGNMTISGFCVEIMNWLSDFLKIK